MTTESGVATGRSAGADRTRRRRSLRYFVPIGIFFGMVVFLWIGLSLDPRKVPSPLIDKEVPAFDLPRLYDPRERFTDETLRGQVSLFNVFASWCVACRQEHPLFMEIARSGQVPLYGLNYKDPRDDALTWLRDLGDPYTAIAYDLEGKAGLDFGVYGVPETFVVDSRGLIRYKHIGPLDWNTWQETVLPLVKRLDEESQY